MDKIKEYFADIFLFAIFLFVVFGILLSIKSLNDKSAAQLQLEYIVEQCSNNKYVILNDVLIMCPDVIVNKPKERKMS